MYAYPRTMFHVWLKTMCILLLLNEMFCMSVRFIWSIVFKFTVSSLILWVIYLFLRVGYQRSQLSTVLLFTSYFTSVFCCCCCSVAQSCLTLCNPMDCSTPGFPVPHHLPEFAQTHVHWVSDATQPSHPLLSPSPPTFNLSRHQGPMSQLFSSGGQSIEASASASVLPMNIQGWFPLGLTGLISLQSKGLSRVFSSTTFQRHQFSGAQPFLLSSSHIWTWLLKKHRFDYKDLCWQSNVSDF